MAAPFGGGCPDGMEARPTLHLQTDVMGIKIGLVCVGIWLF